MHMMNKIMHGTGGLKSETWFEMASGNARATRANADLLNVKGAFHEIFLFHE